MLLWSNPCNFFLFSWWLCCLINNRYKRRRLSPYDFLVTTTIILIWECLRRSGHPIKYDCSFSRWWLEVYWANMSVCLMTRCKFTEIFLINKGIDGFFWIQDVFAPQAYFFLFLISFSFPLMVNTFWKFRKIIWKFQKIFLKLEKIFWNFRNFVESLVCVIGMRYLCKKERRINRKKI